MAKSAPSDSLDVQIGQWIRGIRIARGWSQEGLAQRVGLSFQQIQKYENGSSRISASKLYEFASVLESDVSSFFHGLPETLAEHGIMNAPHIFENDTWKVASQFDRIKNRETRKKILELVTNLAQEH